MLVVGRVAVPRGPGWDGVVAAVIEGIASKEAPAGHRCADEDAAAVDGIVGVLGARGFEAAGERTP
jgi:hypothetical protein